VPLLDGEVLGPSDRRRKPEVGDGNSPKANDDYYTMAGASVAKNVITIGAIHPILYKFDPSDILGSDVKQTNFTSFGPRSDGAVKSDLVAVGS
jgi:hypothetical protein